MDPKISERPREDFYSTKELRNRGWTEEKIGHHLRYPDVLGVNPLYRNAPSIRFYLKERVHGVEKRGALISTQESLEPAEPLQLEIPSVPEKALQADIPAQPEMVPQPDLYVEPEIVPQPDMEAQPVMPPQPENPVELEGYRGEGALTREYTFNQMEMAWLLDHTLSIFMEYQYRHGYEEPQARALAIRDVLEDLDSGEKAR